MEIFKNRPIATVYLERREQKNDNTYPLKIRITHKRKRKYFAIPKSVMNDMLKDAYLNEFCYDGKGAYSISGSAYDSAIKENRRGKYAELFKIFNRIIAIVDEHINSLPVFDFNLFAETFKLSNNEQPDQNELDVFNAFRIHIQKLNSENRVKYADSYQTTMNSLKRFAGRDHLTFYSITPEFLMNYDNWLSSPNNNKSIATVAAYMRNIRRIIKVYAKNLEYEYPFGNDKYKIIEPDGRKAALSTAELQKIILFDSHDNDVEEYYHNIWNLLYFMNGINPKDLCLLKYNNIEGNYIYFIRSKTKHSTKKPQSVKIPFSDQVKEIIEKVGQKPVEKNKYILPVLNDNMNARDIKNQVENFTKQISKYINRIALKCEIKTHTTAIVSRHSWASKMMRDGAPLSFIQKQLSHTDPKTTQNYLAGFEDEQLAKYQKKLTQF